MSLFIAWNSIIQQFRRVMEVEAATVEEAAMVVERVTVVERATVAEEATVEALQR